MAGRACQMCSMAVARRAPGTTNNTAETISELKAALLELTMVTLSSFVRGAAPATSLNFADGLQIKFAGSSHPVKLLDRSSGVTISDVDMHASATGNHKFLVRASSGSLQQRACAAQPGCERRQGATFSTKSRGHYPLFPVLKCRSMAVKVLELIALLPQPFRITWLPAIHRRR
jgi:hypothetical protein